MNGSLAKSMCQDRAAPDGGTWPLRGPAYDSGSGRRRQVKGRDPQGLEPFHQPRPPLVAFKPLPPSSQCAGKPGSRVAWVVLARLPDGGGGWHPAIVLKAIAVYDDDDTEEERVVLPKKSKPTTTITTSRAQEPEVVVVSSDED